MALDAKKDNYKALFQRGQAYFKSGKLAEAKKDLDAFVAADTHGLEFAKQQANKMRMIVDLSREVWGA